MTLEQDRYDRYILDVFDSQGCRSIALEAATYALGRDPTNAIIIHSESVSRQHAFLLRVPRGNGQDGYAYRIVDGNLSGKRSTNGIEVNGKRTFEHDLQNGDRVRCSDQVELRYYVKSMSDEEFRRYADPVSHCNFVTQPVETLKTYVIDDIDETDVPGAANVDQPLDDLDPTRPPIQVTATPALAEKVAFWQRKSTLVAAIVLLVVLGSSLILTLQTQRSDPAPPATSGE